jgi:hypothetical protein
MFLKVVNLFVECVHAFARTRLIPSREQIASLQSDEKLEIYKPYADAMSESLQSLRQKALDAGVNPRDMGSTNMSEMLLWSQNALESVITLISENKPEMKAVRQKLVKFKDDLNSMRARLDAVGETHLFQLTAMLSAMSGGAANTQGQ